MRKSKLSLRRLFSNTKFLIVFSLAVAFVFWIAVALEYAPIIDREFHNVPVTIDLSDSVPEKFGLQMFGNKNFSVDITVRGSRYIIGGDLLKPEDFNISVQTAYVNSTGNHALQISVTPKNSEAEYEVISYYPEYIEVFFDKYDEKEFKVEPRIITELDKLTSDDYIFNEDEIIMSQNTVKVSGAKSEIERIKNVYADIEIDNKLTKNLSVDAPIVFDDGANGEIKYVTAKVGEKDVMPITLPVYKIETLTASVDFKNIPSEYIDHPLSYISIPRTFKAAVIQDGETKTTDIKIGTIDFTEISDSDNRFIFKAEDIQNVKILDETILFNVKIDTEYFESYKFDSKNAEVIFAQKDNSSFDYDISTLGNITVVGKDDSLTTITGEDFVVTVDTKNFDAKSMDVIPVTVALKNYDDCWVYGTYNMKISKK